MQEGLFQAYLHMPVEKLFEMLEERKLSEKCGLPLLLLGRAYQFGVSGAPKDALSAYFFYCAASKWGWSQADEQVVDDAGVSNAAGSGAACFRELDESLQSILPQSLSACAGFFG